MDITHKEKLAELIAKLEAGETPEAHEITTAMRPFYSGDEPVVAFVRMACDPSDIRALGAAKALHEAVLPEWETTIYFDVGGAEVKLGGPRKARVKAISDNPARAWLLAILRALYSMEQD